MNCLALLLSFTMHLGVDGNYNNIHPHLQCEKDSLIVGTYYNSEKDISFYMSQNLRLPKSEVEIGLATGYRDAAVVPIIRWKKNNWFIAPMYGRTWYYTEYPDRPTVWTKGEKDAGILIGYEIKIGKRK